MKRLPKRRREQREDPTTLVCALLERDESERKRVAHSVHDGLGHQLLALRQAATQAREHPGVDAALQAQLDSISALASASLETARGIAYRLRPFELCDR